MEKTIYQKLINKLDSEILRLQVSHPVPSPTELPHSVGLIINEDTNVTAMGNDQRILAHSMLHMFYGNKTGKGLSPKTIERLHNEIVPLLKNHEKFDRLDTK